MADAQRLQLTSQGAVLAVTAKPQRLHNLPCNSQHHLPLVAPTQLHPRPYGTQAGTGHAIHMTASSASQPCRE